MHYAIDEWEKLPWWQQWLFMRELDTHLRVQAGQEVSADGQQSYDRQSVPIDGDITDMVDLGVKVEKVTS